jgi:PAS domain S-box-containing protein
LLLAVTGALPLFLVALVLINLAYSGPIDFGEQELRGNALERPLERLLELLPRYREAARHTLSDPNANPDELSNTRLQIDRAVSALAAAYDGELGRALHLAGPADAKPDGSRLKTLQKQWQDLEHAPAMVAANDEADVQLTGSIREMIRYIGDRSNLVLDNDLDSYYLMDITLSALPQTQQRVADITSDVSAWLRNGELAHRQTRIAVLAATLRETDLERITRDARTTLSEDEHFNGISQSLQEKLPPAVERLAAAERPFLTLLNRLATGEVVPAAELESAGWSAHAETFRLFETASKELDRLLTVRVRAIANQRLQAYSIIAATLAMAGFAMALIVRSVLAARYAEILSSREELRTKEQQLRALGDNLPGGVVYRVMRELDGTMRFLHISAGVSRVNGVSAEAALADAEILYSQFPAEDRAELEAAERRSLRDGVPFHAIVRMRRPDGAIRHIEFNSAPHVLPDGRAVWDGIQMDVTDRQLAESEIKQSEQRFSRIFENNPMPITLSGFDDGKFIAANDSFLRFSGFSRAEVIGNTTRDMKVYQDYSQREYIFEQLRTHGRLHAHEQTFRAKSGNIRQTVLWIDLITIGGRECVLTISLDVSEQRRAERQQKELEEQLRQAQKLDALGTLAGGIAHDFNNILGAIISYVELSKMDNEANGALQSNLDEVLRASARATNLVRQILSFSRQQKEERKPLQLAPIVKEALSLLRATLPSTIGIEQRIDEALPDVLANPTQLHQIIMNLCTNAAHAMRGRQGQLSVELGTLQVTESGPKPRVEMKPGIYVQMIVQDTGAGMDEATAKRIFEPFFTTKASGEGTGLGLSVVHGIVTEYGGVVTVESELGRGTKLAIYLPACAALEKPAAPVSTAIVRGKGERILFVDDEPVLGDVAQKMMQRLGYQATVLQSSEAALTQLLDVSLEYDALITDLTMPGMTGVELSLKALAVRPTLRIILVSGSSGQLTATDVRKLGIRELLSKPLDYATLARVLSQVLQS